MTSDDFVPRRPLERGERLAAAAAVVVVLGLFAADVASDFHPVKLSALFVLLAWLPLIALHEAGHALMAKLVGWHVCEVVVGLGPRVLAFRVGGVPVSLNAVPLGGYVVPAPRSAAWARTKNALVYAAGPGIELALVAVLWAAWGGALFERSEALGTLAVQSLALAAALGALLNLVPLPTAGGQVTDGLGILLSPTLPREHFERHVAVPYVRAAERRLVAGDVDGAGREAARGLEQHPGNFALRCLAARCRAAAGDDATAWDELDELSRLAGDEPRRRLDLLLARTHVALAVDHPFHAQLADQSSREAWALARSVEARIARAEALFANGKAGEARPLFDAVLAEAGESPERDRARAGLALIAIRAGTPEAALDHVRALERSGAHALVTRVAVAFEKRRGGASASPTAG